MLPIVGGCELAHGGEHHGSKHRKRKREGDIVRIKGLTKSVHSFGPRWGYRGVEIHQPQCAGGSYRFVIHSDLGHPWYYGGKFTLTETVRDIDERLDSGNYVLRHGALWKIAAE